MHLFETPFIEAAILEGKTFPLILGFNKHALKTVKIQQLWQWLQISADQNYFSVCEETDIHR